MPEDFPCLPCPTSGNFTFILLFLFIVKNCYVVDFLSPMDNFYSALIDEELHLEEDALRTKEQELLASIILPSSVEVLVPVAEASSSQVVPEASEGPPTEIPVIPLLTVSSPMAVASPAATSLPIIELTSPVSSEKSLAEVAPNKRPGRKLTRAPPSKRRLILPADDLVSEGFVLADLPSDEPTLAELYPSLIFPASPSSGTSAPGAVSFTSPLSIPESGSLPSSPSSYLVFAPPSILTSSFSVGSSTIPVLHILLGGSFASA
ncbi:cell wall protein TIR4-like [Zingiber officinale]|uniref:cell wall protein TIR4-like n=1 Tax=Zingiber officinale TaxID=94328 RepID=UPI001C4CC7A7|nr:cell wall protein TIR4-like [Zingiber officinale]